MIRARLFYSFLALLIVLTIAGILVVTVRTRVDAQAKGQSPKFVEDLTVGHYRSWDLSGQSAYVLGVYSFAVYHGLTCPTKLTVGEYHAALVHNRTQIQDTDPLAKVMVALFLRNGCEVR